MYEREREIGWSGALKAGVPEIDKEHRQFVACVKAPNMAIVECEDKPAIERLLELMLTDAAHHCRHEQ